MSSEQTISNFKTRGVDDPTYPASRPSIPRQIVVIIGLLVVVAAIAVIGSTSTAQHTDGWYTQVERVAWSPPDAVFGPAWTVLYICIALSGFFIWRDGYRGTGRSNGASGTLWIYTLQLLLNFAWTPIFFSGYPEFGEPAWWVALGVILALVAVVIWLIGAASRHSKTAGWLLLPYLAWLIFASTLNAGIIALN